MNEFFSNLINRTILRRRLLKELYEQELKADIAYDQVTLVLSQVTDGTISYDEYLPRYAKHMLSYEEAIKKAHKIRKLLGIVPD